MYFVPAFTGLLAPHWRADARGVIIGLTWSTNRAHIARALLEAICFQTQELLSVVRAESGLDLDKLLVDGGMANDPFILQMLADITGLTIGTASRRSHVSLGSLCSLLIEAPKMNEATALGAAIAAAIGGGLIVSPPEATAKESTAFMPLISLPGIVLLLS